MQISDGWHQSKSGLWYNSNVCRGLAAHIKAICEWCKTECFARKHRGKDEGKPNFCSRNCKMLWQTSWQDHSHLKRFEFKKGQPAHNYKGRSRHTAGYNVFCEPGGTRQLEHRLVVEKFLGRKLRRTEVIHHINGDRTDNRIENLQIMDQSEHVKLHQEEEKMRDPSEYREKKSLASMARWKKQRGGK